MKTIRFSLLLLASLAGLVSATRAADHVSVRGILISASNEKGESDRRLAAYAPNLKRILQADTFHFLGEDSAALPVPGDGALALGEGQRVELATESTSGKTVLLKIRWGSVRQEYVLQRGGTTVLVGPGDRKGGKLAVILSGE